MTSTVLGDTIACNRNVLPRFDDGYECVANSGHWEDVGQNEGLNGHPSNEIYRDDLE